MKSKLRLFMLMVGCEPVGRHTEQHDVYFGIGETVKEMVPQLERFWPDGVKLHVDVWREVSYVDGFAIDIEERSSSATSDPDYKLYFINLGGYEPGLFDERHYKMVTVQKDKAAAIQYSKTTEFYKKIQFKNANSHIDDKYGIDVDNLNEIGDVLPSDLKDKYRIVVRRTDETTEDELHIGYFKLTTLK